jgi:hypothetical protein
MATWYTPDSQRDTTIHSRANRRIYAMTTSEREFYAHEREEN